MSGNKETLSNFKKKFAGIVRYENNQFSPILGYGDSSRKVSYVEGLGHNLFSIGKFCDKGLEVKFMAKRCAVKTDKGKELLVGSRKRNLYTIDLNNYKVKSDVCLLTKALDQ